MSFCSMALDGGPAEHWQSSQRMFNISSRSQHRQINLDAGHAGPLNGAGDSALPLIPVSRQPEWIDEILRDISTAAPGKQIAIGGISGWVSGYLLGKIGKAAAMAVGGSLIILQIAQYQGLIQVNWDHIERRAQSTRRTIHNQFRDNFPTLIDNVKEYGRKYIFLTGSFCAGFLLGVAT